MKTTAKDVILLCKGWYDKEKYPTILDALKQYYRIHYSTHYEDLLCERFLLKIVLLQAMQEIVKDYPDRLISFVNSYAISEPNLFIIPDSNNRDFDYQMFYRVIYFLSNLQMYGEGLIGIDTEEYFIDEQREDGGVKHKRLIEDII